MPPAQAANQLRPARQASKKVRAAERRTGWHSPPSNPRRLTRAPLAAAAKSKVTAVQTEPPSVPIDAFFPSGVFPEGELQLYVDECALSSTLRPPRPSA